MPWTVEAANYASECLPVDDWPRWIIDTWLDMPVGYWLDDDRFKCSQCREVRTRHELWTDTVCTWCKERYS